MDRNKKSYYAPMHTAEHILNGTMVKMFDCKRSENCHIEKKKSRCYFELAHEPSQNEIILLEQKIKEEIAKNHKVTEQFLDFEEAAMLFDLSRIQKEDNPMIRIIKIGDYDDCPCIGEHVEYTMEIENFHISSTSYEDGVFKVRFKV